MPWLGALSGWVRWGFCENAVNSLNPTLADGLWSWRQHLGDAGIVISALAPERGVRAARELARELAGPERTVVLTGIGASEPLFWHIPAGKEMDSVRPDLVLLLVQNCFTPSARLLLATANRLFLLAGSEPGEQADALRLMQIILRDASPSQIEVVAVSESLATAREATGHLVSLANGRFGNRATWRHIPARPVREAGHDEEEGTMASSKPRSLPLSEVELRAREWDESFRRAEKLLQEAQETLRRQLARPGESVPAARPGGGAEDRAQAL